jgi:hypothetical protein
MVHSLTNAAADHKYTFEAINTLTVIVAEWARDPKCGWMRIHTMDAPVAKARGWYAQIRARNYSKQEVAA